MAKVRSKSEKLREAFRERTLKNPALSMDPTRKSAPRSVPSPLRPMQVRQGRLSRRRLSKGPAQATGSAWFFPRVRRCSGEPRERQSAEDYACRACRRFSHPIGFECEIQDRLEKAGKKEGDQPLSPVVDFYHPKRDKECHEGCGHQKSDENEFHGIQDFKRPLGDKEGEAEDRGIAYAGRNA